MNGQAGMSRVLVVEDEAAIAELVALHLRHAGFEVERAADAAQAVSQVDAALPDLVVLDWMLPGGPGLSLARHWRAMTRTREMPIIMLTARSGEDDRVAGLDAGADDYLVKPFSPRELMARVRAVLRRRAPQALDTAVRLGPLVLDPTTHELRGVAGGVEQPLRIGPSEFKLLHFLMLHPRRVHTRAQLLDKVWGDHVFIEERTVDVHIRRLRQALEPAGADGWVQTVRGAGYRLVPPGELP